MAYHAVAVNSRVVPFLETCYYLTQQAEQIKQERKSTQLVIPASSFLCLPRVAFSLGMIGLVPLEILPSAAAVTSQTLFIVYIKVLDVID
ncbi:hypothetical protein IMY05_016G0084400 [Salix suchowensis]|nr:hypothetical protein IMY05_016G0084400 [Salix suchowensis]